jgi:hypothetical protein
MTRPAKHKAWIEPRLLSRKQAAVYCGMCAATFDRVCPVPPVEVGLRTHLFDRRDLDRWIDALNANKSETRNWLAALDDDRNSHAHQRN